MNPAIPNIARELLEGMATLSQYHTGYVEVSKKNYGREYDKFISRIDTDELTFAGTLNWFLKASKDKKEIPPIDIHKDIWFFGFDSAHHWNDQRPESKTFKSVKARTVKLCDEMIRKKI